MSSFTKKTSISEAGLSTGPKMDDNARPVQNSQVGEVTDRDQDQNQNVTTVAMDAVMDQTYKIKLTQTVLTDHVKKGTSHTCGEAPQPAMSLPTQTILNNHSKSALMTLPEAPSTAGQPVKAVFLDTVDTGGIKAEAEGVKAQPASNETTVTSKSAVAVEAAPPDKTKIDQPLSEFLVAGPLQPITAEPVEAAANIQAPVNVESVAIKALSVKLVTTNSVEVESPVAEATPTKAHSVNSVNYKSVKVESPVAEATLIKALSVNSVTGKSVKVESPVAEALPTEGADVEAAVERSVEAQPAQIPLSVTAQIPTSTTAQIPSSVTQVGNAHHSSPVQRGLVLPASSKKPVQGTPNKALPDLPKKPGLGHPVAATKSLILYPVPLKPSATANAQILVKRFSGCGHLTWINVPQDLGYAFLNFDSVESATSVLKTANGERLFGHERVYMSFACERSMPRKLLPGQWRPGLAIVVTQSTNIKAAVKPSGEKAVPAPLRPTNLNDNTVTKNENAVGGQQSKDKQAVETRSPRQAATPPHTMVFDRLRAAQPLLMSILATGHEGHKPGTEKSAKWPPQQFGAFSKPRGSSPDVTDEKIEEALEASYSWAMKCIDSWRHLCGVPPMATFLQDGVADHHRYDIDTDTGKLLPGTYDAPESVIEPGAQAPHLVYEQMHQCSMTSSEKLWSSKPRQVTLEQARLQYEAMLSRQQFVAKRAREQASRNTAFRCRQPCHLRPAEVKDMDGVASIYNTEVRKGWRAEDLKPVSARAFASILAKCKRDGLPFVVAVEGYLDVGDAADRERERSVMGFAYVDIMIRGLLGSSATIGKHCGRVHFMVRDGYRRQRLGTALLDSVMSINSMSYTPKAQSYQFVNQKWDPVYFRGGPRHQSWVSLQIVVYVRFDKSKANTRLTDEYKHMFHWLEDDFGFNLVAHVDQVASAYNQGAPCELSRLQFEHRPRVR